MEFIEILLAIVFKQNVPKLQFENCAHLLANFHAGMPKSLERERVIIR